MANSSQLVLPKQNHVDFFELFNYCGIEGTHVALKHLAGSCACPFFGYENIFVGNRTPAKGPASPAAIFLSASLAWQD